MKKDYTHISFLLDRSGSMNIIAKAMMDGYNEYIGKQKTIPGKATVSVSQFDDIYDVLYEMIDINDVPLLTDEVYIPRGWTALNDATAKLINRTGELLAAMPENERPEKVIFVVISDGSENYSKEFANHNNGVARLKEITERQEKVYNWEFVYIGANQNSHANAAAYGMANSLNYLANDASVKGMFSKLSNSSTKMRTASVRGKSLSTTKMEIADNDTEEDLTADYLSGKIK